MRNLQVFRDEWINLKLENAHEGEVIVAAAYDTGHDRLFLASDALIIYSLNFASGQGQRIISLMEEDFGEVPWFDNVDKIIGMEFLPEKEALLLGIVDTGIIFVNPSSLEVEEIFVPTGGLVSLSLSPDGELLVFVTGHGQLHVMTQDWDLLYDICLDEPPGRRTSGLIPPGSVQISWRGDGNYFSTLEASYDVQSAENVDTTSSIKVWETETGALHSTGEPLRYSQLALSWSPTGARIATACCRPDTVESPIVVLFERNGLKRSSFDILAPPEAKVESLQWNANSELLAILVRCGETDFVQVWNISNFHWYLKQEWRFSAVEKIKMFWDPEKPLQLLCWTASGRLRRITLLWKSAVTGGSTAFVIDGRDLLITSFSLSIIPPPMFTFKVNFPTALQTVATLFENMDRCLIAAILADGSCSVVNLPGVESWDDLEGRDISAVQVKSDPVLDFCQLRHIAWLGSKTLVGLASCGVTPPAKDVSVLGVCASAVYPFNSLDPGGDYVLEFSLQLNEGNSESLMGRKSALPEKWMLRLDNQTLLDQHVLAIAANPSNLLLEDTREARKAEAYIELTDGSVVIYSCGGNTMESREHGCNIAPSFMKFASPSPFMDAIIMGDVKEDQVVLIGLNEHGRLQVNDQLVSRDCTSFTTHESIAGESKVSHLVFTTRLDALHVLNLVEILAGSFSGEEVKDVSLLSSVGKLDHPTTLVGKSGASKFKGVNAVGNSLKIRPMWERGARLVATVGGTDVAVILQTVRGNLETIYPRGLVLGAMATALTQENFRAAVLLARRHHINLNVIVDYKGWKEFSLAAGTFVQQLGNLSHVTEVVQALNNENVMETTYKNLIPIYQNLNSDLKSQQPEVSCEVDANSSLVQSAGLEESKSNKVQGVLSAIRSALQKEVADSPARELCILTTLARSDPPELEAALERIRGLREAEIKGISDGDISRLKDKLSAESAVKHLIWLTEADIVFSVALGLYDLHLAAMVASHSQKDPKEFLPLLEELGHMPPAEMKYNVDSRLGRFESALHNCADMGRGHFDKCIQLVRANPTLFHSALQIFRVGEERIILLDAWGDHLVDEKKFEDAGATFCACSRFDKALDAYRLGGFWESVMTMAGRLGKTSAEVVDLAIELRDELQALGKPQEAAKLTLDYCRDIEGAIILLLDAHEWLEVARLAYLHNKTDLLSTQLEPAILESANAQLNMLDEGIEKVGKYLARFLAIHQRRLLLAAKLTADADNREAVDDDASSDISFVSSTHSNVSGLSGLSAYTRGTMRTQSTLSSVSGKGGRRQARAHKSQGGRIRAGSPGEELALVEHLKGMALDRNSLGEHRALMQALMQLGHESTARRLQQAVSRFISLQIDAVRQAEEKMSDDGPSRDLDLNPPDMHWQWEILK